MSAAAAEAAKYGKDLVVGIIKERAMLKAALEKAKAETKSLTKNIVRRFEDRDMNLNLIREQFIQDEMNLQEASVKADSAARETFAGSGVTGASRDDITKEIERDVAQSRIQLERQRENQVTTELRDTEQTMENAVTRSKGIGTEFKGHKTRMFLNKLGAGANFSASQIQREEQQEIETKRRASRLAIPQR